MTKPTNTQNNQQLGGTDYECQLRETIRYLNRDIETLALQLTKSQQLSQHLIRQLEVWIKKDHSISTEIKSNVRRLKHQLMVFKRLEKLTIDFEQVNAAFYQKLLTQSSDLTKVDLELCAYTRMGLNKKEVALLRGVAPDSVKRHYNRLRKRLRLEASVNLRQFLIQLTNSGTSNTSIP